MFPGFQLGGTQNTVLPFEASWLQRLVDVPARTAF